ncbi:DUF2891 domain-containing protein [Flavobacterium macrobrachii]|uniref:DUF2891 domain-containing protein n=1 Tax=Flavobacterium macrobrachii TaxID=591204 RepID=A0ABS2D0U1_9FLAO|nr:DUF2891 domain-containing protein [Flavobacterium macrobrachii]MBM6500459.1 DUF2891 domain-containing protein [Flavobacterium macrobrachii]
MKNYVYILLSFLVSFETLAQELTLQQANHLATLPLKCLQQEYPNKLGQLLIDSTEIQSPKKLHPTFYGCFDWHSSVHGHWSLVYLLKRYPNLANKEQIIQKLKTNLSKENIQVEIDYLNKKHEKSFERTYGWNWLLKLQLELETSNEPFAAELAQNLKPLSNIIIERYIEFLPKLLYPVRVGTHSNTAFGLTNAWDYAMFSKNEVLQKSIKENAIRLFQKDENCPFNWEPSGTDFLSPCMEEMALMQRILPKNEFLTWLKKFAPNLFKKDYKWEVARVSDRTDGHLVHLDGLNFSRAWNMYHLLNQYPNEFKHLKTLADYHLNFSLPSVVDGNYEGEHWLASFALRAFEEKK